MDPLAAFRAKDAPKPAGAAREPYKAFATKDKLRCLDIRTKSGLAHAPGYAGLINLTYNRKTWGEVMLTFARFLVILRGRNLRPIVDALKLHTCEFLAEFDPEEFEPTVEEGAPFIEGIEVRLMGVAPAGAESKNEK